MLDIILILGDDVMIDTQGQWGIEATLSPMSTTMNSMCLSSLIFNDISKYS